LNKPGRAFNIALWILQALLALAFLAAGFSKLFGAEPMVATYEKIGVGQWFRFVTGIIEVLSAVLLLVPGLAGVGALLIVATMIGATFTHLFIIGGSPVPALVLLILAAVVA
jgi:putative oxidoreductase